MNPKSILTLLLRLIVGGVLIYSGASKALVPIAEFAAALEAYKLLPHGMISPLALVWPWAELLAGTYLFFGYFTPVFAKVAAAMFFAFIAVLGSALLRGIDPGSCGCFGIGLSFSLKQALALDAAMAALSILLITLCRSHRWLSADAWIDANNRR